MPTASELPVVSARDSARFSLSPMDKIPNVDDLAVLFTTLSA